MTRRESAQIYKDVSKKEKKKIAHIVPEHENTSILLIIRNNKEEPTCGQAECLWPPSLVWED